MVPGNEDYDKLLEVLGTNLSENIFKPLAEKRQPRTSLLVKGARVQGNRRVAAGKEACENRNVAIAEGLRDRLAMVNKFDGLLREPFQDLT